MRLGASRSQLYDAQKTARLQWESTEEVWSDRVRSEFEEAVWLPLDQLVSETLRSIDQLSVAFSQIRTECEFPS